MPPQATHRPRIDDDIMQLQLLNIFHVLIAIAMVAFILVQRGAGATAGAAFGAGASGTVFGARGAGNFLSKTTWLLATGFCAISLAMAVIVSRSAEPDMDLGVVGGDAAPVEAIDVPPASGPVGDEADDTAVSDLPAAEAPVTDDLPPVDAGAEPETDG